MNGFMQVRNLSILFFTFLVGCQSASDSELIDAEGNRYAIKKYGEKLWMVENLRVRMDSLGNAIEFYLPDGNPSNMEAYGLLYDYETACKVCPQGWRLPSNEDWEELFEVNGGKSASHYKSETFWEDEKNTNSTQFSVRPTGSGNNGEHPNHFGDKTLFWSLTKEDEHFVWTYIFEKGRDTLRTASQHPTYAFSIRCVKR